MIFRITISSNLRSKRVPVIESSVSSVEVSARLGIRCDFKALTKTIEWAFCDDNARKKMESLAHRLTSGSRYAGVLTIDGLKDGVTTPPLDLSSFSGGGSWSYCDAGSHEVGCQIDNGLNYVVENTQTDLRQVVRRKIGALTDVERIISFDPANVIQVATELLQAQIQPLPAGVLARTITGPPPTGGGMESRTSGFNPRSEYPAVNQEQGPVKRDSNQNVQTDLRTSRSKEALSASDATAVSNDRLTQTGKALETVRVPLTCNLFRIGGCTLAKTSTDELWVENTSSTSIDPGRKILFKGNVTSISPDQFGVNSKQWTTEGTHSLTKILSVGQKIKIHKETVSGYMKGCEMWAQ